MFAYSSGLKRNIRLVCRLLVAADCRYGAARAACFASLEIQFAVPIARNAPPRLRGKDQKAEAGLTEKIGS